MKKKLRNHPYSQCHVLIGEDAIVFVSYNTPVVGIYENGIVVAPAVDCTATTRRQVSWFCKEYLPGMTYHDLKRLKEKVAYR